VTGDEKNRYVLEQVYRRLARGDGFTGRIVLHCGHDRINAHVVEQTIRTDELLEENNGPGG